MISPTTKTEVGEPRPIDKNVKGAPSTDFGFLPIPKRLRYDPDKPFHFGLVLNASFGFASTFSACPDHCNGWFLTTPFFSCRKLILLSALAE